MRHLRFLLCLVLCTLLSFPASAEPTSAYLARLDILSQLDPRLTGREFVYRGKNFWECGCQPASVANGLIACFGEEVKDAPALLSDVIQLVAPKFLPKSEPINLNRLSYLWADERKDSYPTLNRLLDGVDSIASVKLLDMDATLSQAVSMADQRFLLHGRITLISHWDWLSAFTTALDQAGLGDARMVICSLGTGTSSTRAPFRSAGPYGHYASLFLQVHEFAASGTLYMLDSYPRALSGESYGKELDYRYAYAFGDEQFEKEMAHFTDVYSVTRVKPTVLQVSLKEEEVALLTSAATPEERVEVQVRQLTPLQLYGTGVVFIFHP